MNSLKPVVEPTALVLNDAQGNPAQQWPVEVFFDPEREVFGVRFLEGEYLKGCEAIMPASAAASVLRERQR